jgi:ABC-2 type transport system permease protein
MLTRTAMMAWKEFIQIGRDARTLTVVIVMPLLLLMIYGYAINLDVKHLRLGVFDQDRTPASRDLVGSFGRSEYFDIAAHPANYREATALLDGGRVKAVLVIPRRFAADLAVGRTVPVQLLIDGSDSTAASTAIGYANAIFQQDSAAISIAAATRAGVAVASPTALLPVDARLRFWYNPELKSTNFIIPGLIAVLLMMLAALLTSMTVVRERERGTIEQLVVSPVLPHELMLGKLLPYVVIAFGDVILVIAAGRLLFDVPLVGSPALVLGLSAVFLTAALGIGLLISTISPSQQSAMTLAMMSTQLPTILLSGFVFPISAMPTAVQWLTNLVPARHFLVIVRAIFLKGSGMELLWRPTIILLVFGVVMLGLSSLRFRKRL